jgi:hypothetical protein
MYDATPHPDFLPLAEDTVVWRYMETAKFLSIINDQALFFSRSDLMTDRWEGAIGPRNIELAPQLYGEHYSMVRSQFSQVMKQFRASMYLNCWHASTYESAAMWSLYQNNGQGIAVRTEWHKLKRSLRGNWPIHGGAVKYVDYAQAFIPEGNVFAPFMHKRLSFAHENEVRLVLWAVEASGPKEPVTVDDQNATPQWTDMPPGYAVPVDLTKLTDQIFIAPDAPAWYQPLIDKIVKRYGLPWQVVQSDLAQDPVW